MAPVKLRAPLGWATPVGRPQRQCGGGASRQGGEQAIRADPTRPMVRRRALTTYSLEVFFWQPNNASGPETTGSAQLLDLAMSRALTQHTQSNVPQQLRTLRGDQLLVPAFRITQGCNIEKRAWCFIPFSYFFVFLCLSAFLSSIIPSFSLAFFTSLFHFSILIYPHVPVFAVRPSL